MSGVRSLELLHKYGSTSRVLNLLRVFEVYGKDPEYSSDPMFLNSKLNKAMIVKHRLRRDEEYVMNRHKKVVTKIIFPLINGALNFGGQSIIFGQKNFKTALIEATGSEGEALEHDMKVLRVIDKLPSLDPFLLRESLKRNYFSPAPIYFDLSPEDLKNMQSFVANEVLRLVEMAFQGAQDDKVTEIVNKMVGLILSDEADDRLEPLRMALGLDGIDFREGIFAWRGFLYFKWQIKDTISVLPEIIKKIDKVKLFNCSDYETKINIARLSELVRTEIKTVVKKCDGLIALYDRAFLDLVDKARALAFREFLLSSPKLFLELGTMMGNIVHISSFWQYKFKDNPKLEIDADEYESILRDFASSLGSEIPKTATV